mmetsp:Transcript_14612/g.24849  ORF Transcript_14612/g.24849 Transcript_14612/m.24849 type:complete len:115 (+) Transcript_14612:653-997(+)
MDNFDDAASFAEQSYPEESEEGKKIRDFFELCRQLAKDLAELLSFMKSQKKCNEKDFLDRLDKFLKSWDAALPDKNYFLKLHHLIFWRRTRRSQSSPSIPPRLLSLRAFSVVWC